MLIEGPGMVPWPAPLPAPFCLARWEQSLAAESEEELEALLIENFAEKSKYNHVQRNLYLMAQRWLDV
jgi:hypothetical protein